MGTLRIEGAGFKVKPFEDLNVILQTEHCDKPLEWMCFFGDEDAFLMPGNTDIFDLLVMLDVFPSKSQAKKNWKRDTSIPDGFTQIEDIGKRRKTLCIVKPFKPPTEENE